MSEADFVVVGAGSAGCVLAARLSEDPRTRVCLIEAGPEDRSALIRVPLGVQRLFVDPRFNWRFHTVPQAHADGRQIYVPRGRGLGGSSTINGMVYTRGHPGDYDDWAALGNPGWSFREVLPYFLRSEDNPEFAGSPYHGQGGPMRVAFLDHYNPLCEVLFQAAETLGYRRTDDFCGPTHEGFGRRQNTIRDGRRESAATAFLAPARGRPNLAVLTGATVARLRLEGGRATGVEVIRGGVRETVAARREVILCAGTIGSPQILMLSGIGPADVLARAGIAPVRDAPGVGRNYQDHIAATMQWRSPSAASYAVSWRTLPRLAWALPQYLLFRRGLLANNILHAGGFVRSRPGLARPDVQFILIPAYRDRKGRLGRGHGFGLLTMVLRPASRGTVTLAGPDPLAPPRIDPRFLSASEDMETLLRGLRIARRLVAAPPFDPHRGPETDPGAAVDSDEGLAAFARATCQTAYHPVGTCRMGPAADGAVVGPDLRLHGIGGLRVADASVMPRLIGGNTNAPAIMIGEKAADLILGRPAPPPAELPPGN